MASERYRSIHPTTGDYPDLVSWEAGEDGDLVSADEYAVAEIVGDWSGLGGEDLGGNYTRLVISGWTTDATRYVVIRADSSNRAGTSWDSDKYFLKCADKEGVIGVQINYVHIEGIQIEQYGSTVPEQQFYRHCGVQQQNAIYLWIIGCFIRFTGTTMTEASHAGIVLDADNDNQTIITANNIIVGFDYGIKAANYLGNNVIIAVYNNTIIDPNLYGIWTDGNSFRSGEVLALKNNIVQGAGTADYFISDSGYIGTYTHSNNISSDTNSPDAAYREITLTFAGAGDYALDAADTDAINAGADLSSDSIFPFSDDILGTSRPAGSWDIGAHEYESASSPVTVDAGAQSLTLAQPGSVASIAAAVNAAAQTLSLTQYGTDVSIPVLVAVGVQSLSLTQPGTSLSIAAAVIAGGQEVSLTQFAAVIQIGAAVTVDAALQAISLVQLSASFSFGCSVSPNVQALSLTQLGADVSYPSDVAAGVQFLTLDQSETIVSIAAGFEASAMALNVAQYAPALSYGCDVIVDETLALVLTALPANVVIISGDVIANISIQLLQRGMTGSFAMREMAGQIQKREISISRI